MGARGAGGPVVDWRGSPAVVRGLLGVCLAVLAAGLVAMIATPAEPDGRAAAAARYSLPDLATTPTSAPRVGALDTTSAAPAEIRLRLPDAAPIDGVALGGDATPVTGGYTDLIRRYFGPLTVEALVVVQCESHFVPWAVGTNTNGTKDHGLFQINDVHAGTFSHVTGQPWETARYDAETNTRFARWLYDHRGWEAWTCGQDLLDQN